MLFPMTPVTGFAEKRAANKLCRTSIPTSTRAEVAFRPNERIRIPSIPISARARAATSTTASNLTAPNLSKSRGVIGQMGKVKAAVRMAPADHDNTPGGDERQTDVCGSELILPRAVSYTHLTLPTIY